MTNDTAWREEESKPIAIVSEASITLKYGIFPVLRPK
jgi:hypothetical protein